MVETFVHTKKTFSFLSRVSLNQFQVWGMNGKKLMETRVLEIAVIEEVLIFRVSGCTLTSCNYLSNFFFFFFWKSRLMICSSWLELNHIPYSICAHRPAIFPTASQVTYSITYKPITEITYRRRPDQSFIPFYPTVIFLCSLPHLFKASLDTPAWIM